MTKTLLATFDGHVIHPDEPISLPANTRIVITVSTEPAKPQAEQSFLKVAQSLNLEGPSDWSERLDDYLYGDRVSQHE